MWTLKERKTQWTSLYPISYTHIKSHRLPRLKDDSIKDFIDCVDISQRLNNAPQAYTMKGGCIQSVTNILNSIFFPDL